MKVYHDLVQRRRYLEEVVLSARSLLMEGYTTAPGSQSEQQKSKLKISAKSSFKDLVTVYDQKVEEFLKEALRKVFPGENIVGEETLAGMRQDAFEACKNLDAFWMIDPIDGTTNYSRSYPFFCSTVTLMLKNAQGYVEPVVGVTFDPTRNEVFSASKGGGAWLNGVQLKVSSVQTPEESLLVTGFASERAQQGDGLAYKLFSELTKLTLGVRRDGSAALDLAYVAAGRLDAYWEWGLAPWDIGAGALMVEEAAGLNSTHDGQKVDYFRGEILSTNALLHKWMLYKLKEVKNEPARY